MTPEEFEGPTTCQRKSKDRVMSRTLEHYFKNVNNLHTNSAKGKSHAGTF